MFVLITGRNIPGGWRNVGLKSDGYHNLSCFANRYNFAGVGNIEIWGNLKHDP